MVDDDRLELAKRTHLLLRAGGHTVATAESLTGGQLAVAFSETPGASETYLGGVVTYATELKKSMLEVSQEVIDEHGVVSAECAQAMASGIKAFTGASFGIATTGVAGPTEQEGKPVGTVFVGIAGPGLIRAVELDLDGDRGEITAQTVMEAAKALGRILTEEETTLG